MLEFFSMQQKFTHISPEKLAWIPVNFGLRPGLSGCAFAGDTTQLKRELLWNKDLNTDTGHIYPFNLSVSNIFIILQVVGTCTTIFFPKKSRRWFHFARLTQFGLFAV